MGIGVTATMSTLFTLMMLESDVKVSLHSLKHVCTCKVKYIFSLLWTLLKSMPMETVPMVMFVWWVAPICMRVESRCASMTSGGQCVTISGMNLMLVWSVNNWDIHTPEVS